MEFPQLPSTQELGREKAIKILPTTLMDRNQK